CYWKAQTRQDEGSPRGEAAGEQDSGQGGPGAASQHGMDETKPLKVRLTFCVLLVGVSLLFAAVVTDHWAVLSPRVEDFNATCEAAHFGLWRLCTKRIQMQEQGAKERGCGPISLPGVQNCSYFKHFTPGQSSEIFEVTTQKGKNSPEKLLSNTAQIKEAHGIWLFHPLLSSPSGLCIIISVEVMRQSVKRMIDSKETAWMEYSYAWSFACACSAFVLLFVFGIILLLIALPRFPQNPWETCMDAEPEH
uniref:Voltage-dependent calcium channel gamma-1 subunit n=1 Tax=Coturnix japonica TaxID=93934 RepID=A0A8C2UHT4_COTJA